MSVNSAASHSYSLGSANEHNGLLASQNSGTITGNLNRRNLVPGTIPEGQIGTDIGGDESAYGAQLNRDTRITINPTDGERNSTPNEATENQAASPLQQGLELTAKKNGLYPLVIVIEAIPKPSHILMDNSRVTRKDEGKNKVDTQTTFASLVYTGEGTFDIKVLKQKIMIDGSSYVLQEIYGFSETASRLDAPLSNTAAGDNKNTTPECVVCMADPKDTIVLPCRHLCLCKDCADQLRKQSQKCPICRQDFHSLLHIKLPKTNKPPTLARNTASISPPSNPSNIIPDTVIPNVDNETAANAQPIHPSAPPFDYHTELPVPINQAPPELNEIPPSIAPLNYDSNCNINTENTVNADQREDGVENAGAQFSSATENMESKPDDKS
ncbi:zinc finger, C3HC4 type-domain-containing protein [Paraphysoderma sedebokerense]|nr:zinc finger, C3HC4 type-domain-containing protein [Paraphysoderma sedebokerense]